MRRISLLVAILAGLLLAACSASSGSTPTGSASGGVRQIEVTLTDDMRMQPGQMQVTAGETIEFVVRNDGSIRHEFFLGGEDDQSSHEMEMREMGGMQHDEDNGIFVDPGQSKTLRHVFTETGSVIAGCHESGHYAAGMKAGISVE